MTSKNIEKYLWRLAVCFMTYLLLGSFIVGKNLFDLCYLILLYAFMIYIKFVSKGN